MRGPESGLRGRGGEGVQTPARLTLAGGSDLFLTHPLLKAKSNHPRKMPCQATWRRFRAPRGHSADPSPAAPLQRTCKTAVKFPAGPGGRVGLEPEREGALQPGNVPTDTQPPVNTGEARLHAPLRKTKGCRTLGVGPDAGGGGTHKTNHEMRPGGPRSGPRSMLPLSSFQNYPWRRGKGGREQTSTRPCPHKSNRWAETTRLS